MSLTTGRFVEMEYRKLGQTDLRPSVLSFGCNRLATMDGDAAEVEATLLEAFERGVNFFDTADCYNQSDSERVLGRVFQGRRDRILICSKAGMTIGALQGLQPRIIPLAKRVVKRWSFARNTAASIAGQMNSQNFQPDYIEKAITRSLHRLRTDYLDLFLLHSPQPAVLLEDSLFNRLDKLRERGMIRHYGVSIGDGTESEALGLCLTRPNIAALQIDIYQLSTTERLQNEMNGAAKGVIGRAPFARGKLFHDKVGLAALVESTSATPAQIAIRLAMQLNPHGTILVGMTCRSHLRENLRALELSPISNEKLVLLDSLQIRKENQQGG